jgi:hypothetical protein
MNPTSVNLSVTDPLQHAWARMKLLLFQPFDAGKWCVIGFCAWLAQLGEQGFNLGGFNMGSGGSRDNGVKVREGIEQGRNYVTDNLYWLGPVLLAVVAIVIVLALLITWLNSRGKFMLLHCVARNVAEVSVPWQKFRREGNSLFLFRLVLTILALFSIGAMASLIAVSIFRMVVAERADVGGILLALGAFCMLFALAIFFLLVRKLTMDFVVPIMFLRRTKCLAAWRELRRLFSGRLGSLLLYLLFQLVIGIVIGSAILVVVLITCCLAGCLMAIPFLGTVLLLPVFTFERAYSAYYLAQFGREYDVFAASVNEGVAAAA